MNTIERPSLTKKSLRTRASSALVFFVFSFLLVLQSYGGSSIPEVFSKAAAFFLVLPGLLSAEPYLKASWVTLRKRAPSADFLSTCAVFSALLAGIFSWVFPERSPLKPELFCGLANLTLSVLVLGKVLESLVERRAKDTVRSLLRLAPTTARLFEAGKESDKLVNELRPGEVILIRAEEPFPVDGRIVFGRTTVDESALTGESLPVQKETGDEVFAGTKNQFGVVRVEVVQAGNETVLAQVVQMVERIQETKFPAAREVDVAARKFVPWVVAGGLTAALLWLLSGFGVSFSGLILTSVFLASSPTAWALASSSAISAAASRAARLGIVFKDPLALETCGKTQWVFFDKTGTLTQGHPEVTALEAFGDFNYLQLLQWSAGAEKDSEHPLARAVLERTLRENLTIPTADSFLEFPSQGREALVDGRSIRIGTLEFCRETMDEQTWPHAVYEDRWKSEGRILLFVTCDGNPAGVLACEDPLRPDAEVAVKTLRSMGVKMAMLTGDQEIPARVVAQKLGFTEWKARARPEQKVLALREKEADGFQTAFVGDGLNDAPALAVADTGFAMGSGIDWAHRASSVILMKNTLSDVVTSLQISRQTLATIRRNVRISIGCSVLVFPIAFGLGKLIAGPVLSPLWATLALFLGPIGVVLSSMMLGRFSSRFDPRHGKMDDGPDRGRAQEDSMVKKVFIEGMSCGHCAARIEKALGQMDGVTGVKVNLAGQFAEVEATKELSEKAVNEAIDSAGYHLVKIG